MRILYVVPYVPNLIRVRPFNLIRRLHARGHQVTVATIWTTAQERDDVRALGNHCTAVEAVHLPRWRSLANCAAALPTAEPLQARYSWAPELMAEIHGLLDRVDVVHIEHLRGARYALAAESRMLGNRPVVWDSVDCISDLFEQAIENRRDPLGRWINRIELGRTRAYEGSAVSRFDRVLVTSHNDRQSLERLAAAADRDGAGAAAPGRPRLDPNAITVLENGVDLEYFSPVPEPREADTIVFSGKLSYHANETAVRHLLTAIMPRVWAVRPGVRVVLVGKDPSTDLRRLVATMPKVTVTGTVPDIRPFLRRAAVAVAPLVYGVGCQNKVLEAMACGTPVVSASRAIGALSAKPGRDVVVADGDEAFAAAVVEVLGRGRQRDELGRAGRAYVEAHHQWDQVAARLEATYRDVIAGRGSRLLERAAG